MNFQIKMYFLILIWLFFIVLYCNILDRVLHYNNLLKLKGSDSRFYFDLYNLIESWFNHIFINASTQWEKLIMFMLNDFKRNMDSLCSVESHMATEHVQLLKIYVHLFRICYVCYLYFLSFFVLCTRKVQYILLHSLIKHNDNKQLSQQHFLVSPSHWLFLHSLVALSLGGPWAHSTRDFSSNAHNTCQFVEGG